MNRKQLESVLEQYRYLKGGTKEASVIAREFLQHAKISGNQIISKSCVSATEFIKAVETLIAVASRQKDTRPRRWKCNRAKCYMASFCICPGEGNVTEKSEESDEICPYFIGEDLF